MLAIDTEPRMSSLDIVRSSYCRLLAIGTEPRMSSLDVVRSSEIAGHWPRAKYELAGHYKELTDC